MLKDVNISLSASQSRQGAPAVLCCAVLCCAVLCCAVLCCAVLCCAVLCCVQDTPQQQGAQDVIDQVRDASMSWGFFQLVNHGVSQQLLDEHYKVMKK
jgi:hypothetical protein